MVGAEVAVNEFNFDRAFALKSWSDRIPDRGERIAFLERELERLYKRQWKQPKYAGGPMYPQTIANLEGMLSVLKAGRDWR